MNKYENLRLSPTGGSNNLALERDKVFSMSQTLEEALLGEELNPSEQRVVQAIDVLKVSIQDKQILFATKLFFGSGGVFRSKDLLGFSIDKTIGARDKVRTNDRYEELWEKLEFLLRPNFAEVAILKKRLLHKEIAEIVEIKKPQVDEISKVLIARGIIEQSSMGRFKAMEFAGFIKEVERVEDPNVSDKEIAQKLGTTETRVKRARRRLRIEGRAKQRTPEEIARSQSRARKLLPLRKQVKELVSRGHTTREVSAITGATFQQVKHQRSKLE